jgi:hypothetical protein
MSAMVSLSLLYLFVWCLFWDIVFYVFSDRCAASLAEVCMVEVCERSVFADDSDEVVTQV